MKNNQNSGPKDMQITNNATAVTNKDGNNDQEKGEPHPEEKAEDTLVKPDSDGVFLTPAATEETLNKGEEPAQENL